MLTRRHLALLLTVTLAGCLDPDEPGNLVARTVMEDPSLPRIDVNGTTLHAETFGDPQDPMIVVLHGGPGSDYAGLLPLRALADDGYFVVFWDQRGAGLSRRHDPGDYDYDVLLADLRGVIDHYGGGPLVFIGHSWGAMYATWFLDTYGSYEGRVRGAVLSEPGAFTKKQLDAYLKRLLGSYDLFGERFNDITWARPILTPEDHVRADYAHMMMAAGGSPAEHLDPNNPAPMFRSGAVVNKTLLEMVDRDGFDWTTHLSAFTSEVLFLRGELNEAMPLWHQEELASSYPSAQVVTIPGVGHELIWERPTEYLHEVRAYLLRIGFTGGGQ